jgi:hypothetical protein
LLGRRDRDAGAGRLTDVALTLHERDAAGRGLREAGGQHQVAAGIGHELAERIAGIGARLRHAQRLRLFFALVLRQDRELFDLALAPLATRAARAVTHAAPGLPFDPPQDTAAFDHALGHVTLAADVGRGAAVAPLEGTVRRVAANAGGLAFAAARAGKTKQP